MEKVIKMLSGVERDKLFLELVAEGRYSVSENGDIFKGKRRIAGDRKSVVIGKNGNYFGITRARAMWLVFKGLIESSDHYVCFKDKSLPIHVDNLEIKTRFEMNVELGRVAVRNIHNNKCSAKLTDEQVLALRREFVANPKVFFIRPRSREMGISHATLSFALTGKTYKHVAEPVPKEIMNKPGGNKRPRVWDRKTCPSYVNRVSKPRVAKPKVERIKPTNVVTFKPPKPVVSKPVMSEEEKKKRLDMMKQIGNRLNKAKTFD